MQVTQFPQGRTKNLLINADFRVNQRVYVSGTATAAADEYTLDRWRVLVLGESITFATLGAVNEITCPAGGLGQKIEDLNVRGGPYTISWEGTATCKVNGVSRANGESFTLPDDTLADVVFYSGTLVFVQLEEGSIRTDNEFRHISEEKTMCARYYQQYSKGTTAHTIGGAISSQKIREAFTFASEMRVAPAVSFSAVQDGAGADITSDTTFSAITSTNLTQIGATARTTARTQAKDFSLDAEL